MEPKQNAAGETHLAVSITRFQKLVSIAMGVILFVTMVVLWIVKPEAIDSGMVSDPIPSSMLYVFLTLMGLNVGNMLSTAIYHGKNGDKK
jgi:Mn2+/Fe2+ NRAMP family transporter